MTENGIKTLQKIRHTVFSAALCFLIPLPATAHLAVKDCFSGIFRKNPDFPRPPRHIQEAQKITGLKDQEIKGSVIVSVAGAASHEFAVYAARKMGAKKALVLEIFPFDEIPDHFLMRTHPLVTDNSWGILPFHHSSVRQRLGEGADISLAFPVGAYIKLKYMEVYLEQMIKITKPGGLIIVNLEEQQDEARQQITPAEFQNILSQMENRGAVSAWSAHANNHRFANLLLPYSAPDPSVTYRFVTPDKPSPGAGLQRNLRRESQQGLVLEFPRPSPR